MNTKRKIPVVYDKLTVIAEGDHSCPYQPDNTQSVVGAGLDPPAFNELHGRNESSGTRRCHEYRPSGHELAVGPADPGDSSLALRMTKNLCSLKERTTHCRGGS